MADWMMGGTAGGTPETRPVPEAYGGTGTTTLRGGIIASLTGAPLPEAQGGTGAATLSAALVTPTGSSTARMMAEISADVALSRGAQGLADEYVARVRAIGMQAPARACAITRQDATSLLAYRPLGGPWWQEVRLTASGTGPYNWDQTRVLAMMSVTTAWDAGWTWSGAGWTDAYSSDPTRYVGGRMRQSSTAGNYAEITVTGGGDLYVIITGRTSGGYAYVSIDGDANAANALPHDGTSRYIDCYRAVDLTYRQRIKCATGIAHGAHTIRITVTNTKNAASSSYRAPIEAVGFVGVNSGLPSQANTRAPLWATGVVTAQYQQVEWLGRSYAAAGAGTTGATPPTHTTGSVSDGGVTWTFMASSSYALASHTIQASGSQLEYAYQCKPTGTTSYEDVGGTVHGNETLATLGVNVDGYAVGDPGIGIWLSGDAVTVVQTITTAHSELGATNIADVVLSHIVRADGVAVDHRHVWNVGGLVGWCYPAMWPLLAYDAVSQRYTLDWLATPQGGKKLCADYHGAAGNPIVGLTRDYVMLAGGDILGPNGSGGVPSASPGTLSVVVALVVSGQGIDEFRSASSKFAGMAMNLSAANPPVNGYSSHPIKMYFERASDSSPETVTAGDVWACRAQYLLALTPTIQVEP